MINDKIKDSYSKLVESLKRHQRAENLNTKKEDLIEKLYTDPHQDNFVLKTMCNDQTTLLIGRKGSGKSTIINRFQHEIRKSTDKISLYIDVRTIYSKANDSSDAINVLNALSKEEQIKLSIYNLFIKKIIEEINSELHKSIFDNTGLKKKFIKKFREITSGISADSFYKELEEILSSSIDQYESISKVIVDKRTSAEQHGCSAEVSAAIGMNAVTPQARISMKSSESDEKNKENKYSVILKRSFHVTSFTDNLKKILVKIGISKVFICLDDCSELDKKALDVFIRTLVAPLHNNSDGFFRFKIAFYPDRNILPEIDRQKIDICPLDYYDLYKSGGSDKVEEQAVFYVKRLLQNRIKYFFETDDIGQIENILFDIKKLSINEYYRLIFHICSCVPRNIGKLLFYAERRSIAQGKPLTKQILQEAAEEQYQNEISPVLIKEEFFQYKSYNELYRRSQLLNLLSLIIEKAKDNKKVIGGSMADIFSEYTTSNAPSHFLYVKKEYEKYLSTLELNLFLTRISEQKDKGKYIKHKLVTFDSVVYVINYGLCVKENIIFDDVKNRKYRIERLFEFNDLIEKWSRGSACVKCSSCDAEFDISEWDTIKEFGCFCKNCKTVGVCKPISSMAGDDSATSLVNNTEELKDEHLRILHTLRIESGLNEIEIASELDVSRETIRAYMRKDRVLRSNGYVLKDKDKTYKIK